MDTSLDRDRAYCLDEIERMVRTRTENLKYLRRFFDSDSSMHRNFWMNTIEIGPELAVALSESKDCQSLTQEWFCIGRSLADLQMKGNGTHFVRAASQLMEEFSFYVSNVALQSVRQLKYLGSPPGFLDEASLSDSDVDFKPRLCRLHGSTVFQYLQIFPVPFSLDFGEVTTSLCDILVLSYKKFIDESSASPPIFEWVLKLDAKFKHHFFGLISRRVNDFALRVAHSELGSLRRFLSVAKDEEKDEKAEETATKPRDEDEDSDGDEERTAVYDRMVHTM